MAYASKAGRARTSARFPESHAICDRCGVRYNFVDLQWQFGFAGATLINKRILVCDRCYDIPQDQNRAIVLPADPVPIVNARPQDFPDAEVSYASETPATVDSTTGIPIPNATVMTTVSGQPMSFQPVGRPTGYTPTAQMPLVMATQWNVALPVVSMLSNGTTTITVTTSSPHGLSTNAQVGVQGVLNTGASGAFSITVTSPTQFTYLTNSAIPAGSQLQASTRVTTMNMGIPLTLAQIPQTGP